MLAAAIAAMHIPCGFSAGMWLQIGNTAVLQVLYCARPDRDQGSNKATAVRSICISYTYTLQYISLLTCKLELFWIHDISTSQCVVHLYTLDPVAVLYLSRVRPVLRST